MDALVKNLTEEMERDLGAKLKAQGQNGGAQKVVRLSDRIDNIIDEMQVRIELLKKLKESL